MQNFIQTCLGSLTEIRSVLPSIEAYYDKKNFEERIIPLIFECILEIKKDHTFQFLLVLMNRKIFSKTQLPLTSAPFTTVPKT